MCSCACVRMEEDFISFTLSSGQGDYLRGRHEQLPYNNSTIRSSYHVRDFEVHKLMQVRKRCISLHREMHRLFLCYLVNIKISLHHVRDFEMHKLMQVIGDSTVCACI